MEKQSRLVEDNSFTVHLGADHFRIACDDALVLSMLRNRLRDVVVEEDAFLGYEIRGPTRKRGFYLLLARSGQVLARSRTTTDVVSALGGYLAAHAAGPPVTTAVRVKARVLVGGSHATLLDPVDSSNLFERRLSRQGLAVVDSPFVDIDADDVIVSRSIPWPDLMTEQSPLGHAQPNKLGHVVKSINWIDQGKNRSNALKVAALAASTRSGGREERLSLARRLVERIESDS